MDIARRHLESAKKPLIAVIGSTASGKTAASVDLALAIRDARIGSWNDAEIVNADSRQLYRGMDVGTAKATEQERRGVTHHLFDVLDPAEDMTAAWYQTVATKTIDDILERHHVPLLVGGSMLYVSAVIDGLSFAGKSDPAVRERLSKEYDIDDGLTLHERLHALDPEAAANTNRRNKVYLLRAVEIAEQAGIVDDAKEKTPSPYDVLMIGLRWPREAIVKRIDARTTQLLTSGWIDEVRSLLKNGIPAAAPGMMSHGYREVAAWIEAGEKASELPKLEASIAAQTRQYAKRQMTWWKRDPRIQWIDMQ